MKIVVYEYLIGGGGGEAFAEAPPSFVREGAAMLSAVVADFAACPDTVVVTLRDRRFAALHFPNVTIREVDSASASRETLLAESQAADATILIAPECDGILAACAAAVEQAGGHLLSANSTFIQCASDKQATAQRWAAAGVPTPAGIALQRGDRLPSNFRYPAVRKPRDGAGSLEVTLITQFDPTLVTPAHHAGYRLEQWHPGTPVSVALLSGPRDIVDLPACRQRLTSDGFFQYLGGAWPLPPPLDQRARQLARRALAALPPTRGYVGIDLVLGPSPAGDEDVVIEVNPRHTTSYVGLRAACRDNLAAALVAVAAGAAVELRFGSSALEFDSAGAIRWSANSTDAASSESSPRE